jgi:cytochrome oxidase assembly protein ShyY1
MNAPWIRQVFTRRWLSYLLVTILFAISCVALGMWQFARRDEARVEITRILENFDAAAVPVEDALPTLEAFNPDEKWLPVTLTGTYVIEDEILVRGRPRDGAPGFEVLTPLRLASGDVFIVDRGWLPTGESQDAPDVIPAAPGGEVTVVARLKAGEPSIIGRGAIEGQVATIELPLIADMLGQPTYTGAYGVMKSESPAAIETPPAAVQRPQLDEGPHLSYAFQWILFAIMGFVGLGWAIRNEWRIRNADDPKEIARNEGLAAKKALRRPSDAEIEDDLMDHSSPMRSK